MRSSDESPVASTMRGIRPGLRARWALALVLTVVAVILAACGDGGPDAEPPRARVRIAAIGWAATDLPDLTVTIDDGSGARAIAGASLAPDEDYGQPHSAWLPTRSDGTLVVSVRATLAAGGPATAEVAVPLQDDWEWEFQIVRAATDPIDTCFGCVGSERLAGLPGSGLAIWLVWGGNSISAPVVY